MLQSQLEHKVLIGTTSSTSLAAGEIILKSGLIADDTFNGRTGLQIKPVSFDIRGQCFKDSNKAFRVILVQDTELNGVAPAVTDILSSAGVTAQYNPLYLLNGRFKYLYDEVFTMSATGEQVRMFHRHIKLSGVMSYLGTGSTIGNCGKNNLLMLLVSDVDGVGYSITTALRYTDA